MSTITIVLILLIVNLLLLLYLSFFKKSSENSIATHNRDRKSRQDSGPKGLIPLERAIKIIDNYEARRSLHANLLPDSKGRKFGDTHSVFVDIEEAQAYLSYVEERSKEKNIKVDGLRYYFGAYPHSDKSEKAGYQTLVIFPTVHDQKNGIDHRAVDLERSSSQNDLFFIHKELNKKSKKSDSPPQQLKAMQAPGVFKYPSSAENDMGSSPPRRPKNS